MPNQTDDFASSLQQNEAMRRAQVDAQLQKIYSNVMNMVFSGSGFGSSDSQFEKIWSGFDRYGTKLYTPNKVSNGVLFISRPHLNLNTLNLKMNRFLSILNSFDPQSLSFAIRASLDAWSAKNTYSELVAQSPYLNASSAWFNILGATCTDMSGAPGMTLETYTSEGGYHSEATSFAIGSDGNKKPIDLQLTFVDPSGGPVAAIIQYWLTYIDKVTTGEIVAHSHYRESRKLDYTVSIYRFLLDPSRQYIVKWQKFTGCFPTSFPSGAMFDMSRAETFVEACKNFTVTFKCVLPLVPNDPVILSEFNMLAERYCPALRAYNGSIEDRANSGLFVSGRTAVDNYTGIPYITTTPQGHHKLDYFVTQEEIDTTLRPAAIDEAETAIDAINEKYALAAKSLVEQHRRAANNTTTASEN